MQLITFLSLPLLAAALSPTLYSSNNLHHDKQIALSAPQANAVFAHYLGVAHHERLPSPSHKDKEWLSLLESDSLDAATETSKVVVVLECGKDGCEDVIPSTLTPMAKLPSLPAHSYLALLSLHLNRLADSYSTKVWGLDQVLQGLKAIEGWFGWVGEELRSVIAKVGAGTDFKTQMEKLRSSGRWVGDVDTMDETAKPLLFELEHLTDLVDSFASSERSHQLDDGPQGSDAQGIVIHIKGLSTLTKGTPTYAQARSMLQKTLSAALSSLQASSPTPPTVLLLSLPPYSPPLLRKRSPWLKPFNANARYTANTVARPGLHKRAEGEEEGRVSQTIAARTPTPVVPTTSMCFTSASDVQNQTASCNGHGMAVLGVTTRRGLSSSCWVCSCESGWGGEGCQKQDLSGDFTLLFFSSFGLILVLFVSVVLLYNVGTVELPGTLASVSGAGGAKRD